MAELTQNPVKAIIESDLEHRVHSMNTDICSFDATQQVADAWREDGHFIVFSSGTFDLLTLNHILSLIQCRVLGAMTLLDMDKIETEMDRRVVHEVAASDSIKLMITMDTNQALEEGKSRRLCKGGGPKPTLDWDTRSMMLAMQSIPAPTGNRKSAVDYITRHGPNSCALCAAGSCKNEDNSQMAIALKPDLMVVNSASIATVANMEAAILDDHLPETKLAKVIEEETQYFDLVLGAAVKTTEIVNRIRS